MSRPSYSAEKNEAVRQELVRYAVHLLRDIGPEELSLRKLSKAMGVSHTKVYRYFENKDALLAAIKMTALTDLQKTLRENDPADASPLTRLRAASRNLYEFASENRVEYLFLFATAEKDTELSDDLIEKRHDVFNDIVAIANIAKENGHTPLDGRTLANLAWAMLHGLFMLNFLGQLIEGRTFEELFEDALDQMFGQSSKAELQKVG